MLVMALEKVVFYIVLLSCAFCSCVNSDFATKLDSDKKNISASLRPEKETEITENSIVEEEGLQNKSDLIDLLDSHQSIFNHVAWGNKTLTTYTGTKNPFDRVYFGYGECPKRFKINFEENILDGHDVPFIVDAYLEMFRTYCDDNVVKTVMGFLEKGYAILDSDHSISISTDTIIFIKYDLSPAEVDELQALLELSAFTKAYVAWYRYPVASIDPIGEPIKDACFIELIATLHVVDMLLLYKKRYLPDVTYSMGNNLKPILKEMLSDLKKIQGRDNAVVQRKIVATNSLAVIMGLMEFLVKHSDDILKGHYGCAHSAFEKFYAPKRSKYVKFAMTLGNPMTE